MDSTSIQIVQKIQNTFGSTASCSDTVDISHWYNYYNDAYSNLITTHVGLFGALIATAVALFGIKYFYENINIENKINETIKNKTIEINNKFEKKTKIISTEMKLNFLCSEFDYLNNDGKKLKKHVQDLNIISNDLNSVNELAGAFSDTTNRLIDKIKDYPIEVLKEAKEELILLHKYILHKISSSQYEWFAGIEKDSLNQIIQKIQQ